MYICICMCRCVFVCVKYLCVCRGVETRRQFEILFHKSHPPYSLRQKSLVGQELVDLPRLAGQQVSISPAPQPVCFISSEDRAQFPMFVRPALYWLSCYPRLHFFCLWGWSLCSNKWSTSVFNDSPLLGENVQQLLHGCLWDVMLSPWLWDCCLLGHGWLMAHGLGL